MSTSQEKVLEMVARGELSADQADSLLDAMQRKHSRLRALFHPLDALPIAQVLLAGLVAAGSGIALGSAGVRFDGALDMHLTPHVVAWSARALDLLVAWPLPALSFWVGLRIWAKQARLIDFVAAVGIARVPAVIGAALPVMLAGRRSVHDPARFMHEHPAQLALIAIVGLTILVWQVAVLYNGVKTAAGLSGKKFAVAFAALLIGAEVASKLVLHAAR